MHPNQQLRWRYPETPEDMEILAGLNEMLIRDEGHRNPMSRAQLRERMEGWIGGDYHAAIFACPRFPIDHATR